MSEDAKELLRIIEDYLRPKSMSYGILSDMRSHEAVRDRVAYTMKGRAEMAEEVLELIECVRSGSYERKH